MALYVSTILATGTDILRRTGRLVGDKKVAVTSKEVYVIELIATACRLREAKHWIPREATSSNSVPTYLVILGAGAISYSGFGAWVTGGYQCLNHHVIGTNGIRIRAPRRPRQKSPNSHQRSGAFGHPPSTATPVDVGESLRAKAVAGGWLYARADVNGRSPLTHMCRYHARIANAAIIRQAKGSSSSSIPDPDQK
ncbi:MAG: hypothetical protein LQ340_004069 [Diploschistes diacapsis]|nr:MAG: hypothetical protein LQ340_004069 [Diploschistes diacapsis]